jgi:putative hydrolase of the HAD superfamily
MQKDYKFDAGFYGALNEFSGKIAYFFHSSLQGTECYPEAAGALQLLARRNITQGVVADAQTFTVVQLQRALKRQDAALDFNAVLEPGLRVLSCKVGVRKPSEQLYRQALQLFRERGIQPSEILHVGSRLQLDVVPAKRLGLRTALFAGDASSVQATPEQLKNPLSRPDVLLTQLEQIAEVV